MSKTTIVKGTLLTEGWLDYPEQKKGHREYIDVDEYMKAYEKISEQPIVLHHEDGLPVKDINKVFGKFKNPEIRKSNITGKKSIVGDFVFFDDETPRHILDAINKHEVIPVSNGRWCTVDEKGVQRDIIPDHVAVFLEETPRCPTDKCGINRVDARVAPLMGFTNFNELRDELMKLGFHEPLIYEIWKVIQMHEEKKDQKTQIEEKFLTKERIQTPPAPDIHETNPKKWIFFDTNEHPTVKQAHFRCPKCGKIIKMGKTRSLEETVVSKKKDSEWGKTKYKDYDDCVAKNQDKDSPEGYCAVVKEKIHGNATKKDFKDMDEIEKITFLEEKADQLTKIVKMLKKRAE